MFGLVSENERFLSKGNRMGCFQSKEKETAATTTEATAAPAEEAPVAEPEAPAPPPAEPAPVMETPLVEAHPAETPA